MALISWKVFKEHGPIALNDASLGEEYHSPFQILLPDLTPQKNVTQMILQNTVGVQATCMFSTVGSEEDYL